MNQLDSLERRTRPERFGVSTGTSMYRSGSTGWAWTRFPSSTWTPPKTEQVTLSRGNRWPPSRGDNLADVGGPFKTTRHYFTVTPFGPEVDIASWPGGSVTGPRTGNQFSYTGPLMPYPPDNTKFPPSLESSEYSLMTEGAESIAACKPTNSAADLSVGLAELFREGIPKMLGVSTWQDRTNILRGVGSEYLNYQFGWAPLVSEVKAVMESLQTHEKVWRQYERDHGRVVRRGVETHDETEVTPMWTGLGFSFPRHTASNHLVQGGRLSLTRHVKRRKWFSGAFTYYIPKDDSRLGSFFRGAAEARKVYGLTLDPEVLWNLAPWSWLSDWFLNTGSIISTVSDMATDGLVIHYGYQMEHTIVVDHYVLDGARDINGVIPSLHQCWVTETKQRVKASPYGFGLTFDQLSGRQLSILAALGITRS